jgi:selenocysteine lyase/cysteine desulfurase
LFNQTQHLPLSSLLLYRYEYPSNVYPFLNQVRKGVVIDFYNPKDHRITLEIIKEHVKPETRLISLSSVQFATGYRADLEAIGTFCREHNIIFSVDGIQSVPYRSIDVAKSNIDFLSVGSHKWMMGTEGVAFVYVSERVQKLIHQSAMGWSSVKDAFDHFNFDTNRLRDDAGRYENGTLNYPGIAAMNASLKFFGEFGFDEMEKNTLALSGIIIDMLEKRGVEVVTPKNEAERGGIVSASVENAEEVVKKLQQKNIIVAFRAGRIRFAPYFYTTEEEVRKAVNAVFD